MSTRIYCDVCGTQITEKNDLTAFQSISVSGSGAGRKSMVKVYVSAGVSALHKGSYASEEDPEHVCRHCVIDAVAKTDTRPKETPAAPPIPRIESLTDIDLVGEIARRNLKLS